jgi:hypothetical protein
MGESPEGGLWPAGDSPEDCKTALAHFCSIVDTCVPRLKAAMDVLDYPRYAGMAWSLEKAARSIGAEDLADLAERLLVAGKHGNGDFIKEETEKLLDGFTPLRSFVSALLAADIPDTGEGDSPFMGVYDILELADMKEALFNMDTKKVNRLLESYETLALNITGMEFVRELEKYIYLFDYNKAIAYIDATLDKEGRSWGEGEA